MRSLSEIDTTSKRASRAVGFSWGVAEEIGKSIRLIELFGLAGVKNLNKYFKQRKTEKFESLDTIKEDNCSKEFSFCPIMLGISFLDQIKILDKFEKIKFNKISFPLLFLPFISRGSEIIGKKIYFKFNAHEFLCNLNMNISSNLLSKEFPIFANNVEIKILENRDNFSESEWKNLYKLSEETFVEESDSLRENAAGAGLTDND